MIEKSPQISLKWSAVIVLIAIIVGVFVILITMPLCYYVQNYSRPLLQLITLNPVAATFPDYCGIGSYNFLKGLLLWTSIIAVSLMSIVLYIYKKFRG